MIHQINENNRLLISQPSHAWLSGQLAQFWGNEKFEKSEPWREVCLAAEQHDSGWIEWELNPEWNPETGLPYNFLTMPLPSHLEIWSKGSEWALTMNSYAALLISRHNSFLLELHDFDKEPDENIKAADNFREEQMQQQYALLEDLSANDIYSPFIENEVLNMNQLLIRTWDYISLLLCMGIRREEMVHEVPMNTQRTENLKIIPVENVRDEFIVMPWPFRSDKIEVFCETRECNQTYKSQDEMRKYLERQPLSRKKFRLLSS